MISRVMLNWLLTAVEIKMPLEKYTQKSAEYTDHGSKEEHCSICNHYINATTCRIVTGRIVPEGWCKHFVKKEAK